ncbi:MAG: choice-of-anchor D domain-containing protein [Lentimicrobiaceae bacterium]
MKNYLTLLISILLIINLKVSGQNILAVENDSITAGQNICLDINITNSAAFCAFQLDIQIPVQFSYIVNSITLDPSRSNGHMVSASLLSGNILRIIAFSFSNNAFNGNSGRVASFSLQTPGTAGLFPLIISNPLIGDAGSNNIITSWTDGSVKILTPDISINPEVLTFPSTPLYQFSEQQVTITNTGNRPLTISDVSFNDPKFTLAGIAPTLIQALESAVVTIRFNSVVKGSYNKMMSISCNDPDEAIVNVPLNAISFAVNELHTGNMFAFSGNETQLVMSINNQESFTGFQFDIVLPSCLSYIPGTALLSSRKTDHVVNASKLENNILRVIAFSPSNQSFTDSTGSILYLSFDVDGIGGWYPLNLNNVLIAEAGGTDILSASYNGYLEIGSASIYCDGSLDFGNVSVLEESIRSFSINNYGQDTLEITQIQFLDASFSNLTTLPVNILPWQSINLQLRFQNINEGTRTTTMRIFSNDPDDYPKNVTLTGNAYIPNFMNFEDAACLPLDTVGVTVSVDNLEEFVGFQFDLAHPVWMQYINNSAVLSTRSQSHILNISAINDSLVRAVSFSFQQLPFLDNSGTIVTMSFVVNAPEEIDTIYPELTNAILSNNLSQNTLWQVRNGKITINRGHKLSGIFYYSNATNTPLDSIQIILAGGSAYDTVLTNAIGYYEFLNKLDGSYEITANIAKPWSGVNSTDALKVQRHMAELELITDPLKLLAADVNNSGSANATDALRIKRRTLGLDISFTKPDWLYGIGGPLNNNIILNDADLIQNFQVICTGDVNGSNIPQ